MIPQEVIKDILNKADIVQVISAYINVIKKGNGYVSVCPFHDDHNPSMQINPKLQIFRCFSCGTGGNVFTFVEKYEHVGFLDAVKKVAEIINYSSPLLQVQERIIDDKTKSLLKVNLDASNFYHYVLSTNAGIKGKEYFSKRNISQDMIDYFSLGFAPENGQFTIKQLRSKDNEVNVLEEVGILIHEGSEFTDRFKNRVIFTLFNEYGEVIGFSGRRIEDNDESKYVNSPASKIFNKSNVLYNYKNAKNEALKENCCYVVEGFMDVFSLYRCNIKSVVALMGTAFTSLHAKQLKKLNVELRLCLDGDDAGQHGILKMLPLLDEAKINYKIVNYKGDKRDPDEIFNQDGETKLKEIANNLILKNEFIIQYFLNKNNLNTIDGKRNFVNEISKYIYFTDPLEKEAFTKEIASITGFNYNSLAKLFKSENNEELFVDFSINKQKVIQKKYDAKQRIERQLIHYVLNNPDSFYLISQSEVFPFVDDIYLKIFSYLEEIRQDNTNYNLNDVISLIQSMNENQMLVDEVIKINEEKYPPCENEIINECLMRMKELLKIRHEDDLLNQDAFALDEIARAKLLDQRKGVRNYGKNKEN
ncbi:MAG: DNA primase [Bacilli bacterium]